MTGSHGWVNLWRAAASRSETESDGTPSSPAGTRSATVGFVGANSGDALPDFERPPVSEVALSIQFAPLPIRAIDLGDLHARWSPDFPKLQEQAPLTPGVLESAGSVPFISFGPPPMNRHWWLSADESHLLQVQQDRFILNWRRLSTDSVYPRYPVLRGVFESRLGEFAHFAGVHGGLKIMGAEVTYINDLGFDGRLDQVVRLWSSAPESHLGDPAEVRFAASYPIPTAKSSSVLLVSLDPGLRALDSSPTRLLTLTLRGKPDGDTIVDALAFLDGGRRHIVRSFEELTTATMHERWGRK